MRYLLQKVCDPIFGGRYYGYDDFKVSFTCKIHYTIKKYNFVVSLNHRNTTMLFMLYNRPSS